MVGEVREPEAWDPIQALNTGHGRAISTIHANTARDALMRLATCALMQEGAAGMPWPALAAMIGAVTDLVIHVVRWQGVRGGRGRAGAGLRSGRGGLADRDGLAASGGWSAMRRDDVGAYLRSRFALGERLAVVLIAQQGPDAGKVEQKFWNIEQAASERVQAFLRYRNVHGWDIHASANPLRPGAR